MPQEPIRATIFHTSDMHGRLEAMARLSSFARRLRREAANDERRVFFWDAGDAADRRLQITSLTKGAAFAGILTAMGYELQTVGNAISLPYGPQALAGMAERASFPLLAANLRDEQGPVVAGVQEYAITSLGSGRLLGILGLTAPWGGIYEMFGLRLPDFVDVARHKIAEMRQYGAAPIVVLSHLGLEDDRRLAEALPEIDLILGGHSHSRLDRGEERAGVLIAHAGEYARALGRVDLEVDPVTGKVLSRSAQVLDVPESEEPDPEVLAAIEAAEEETRDAMARVVGALQEELAVDHFAECGIGNLAADALRARMGAEAALVASGQFHAGLPAGEVTLGDLDRACFSSANPGVTSVRGDQIRRALERGLDDDFAQTTASGFRGTPVGRPQISGLRVRYAPGAAPGSRVKEVWINGEPLEASRTYLLAHTDAEISPNIGYLELEEHQIPRFEVPTILREVIADYLELHTPVSLEMGRWEELD